MNFHSGVPQTESGYSFPQAVKYWSDILAFQLGGQLWRLQFHFHLQDFANGYFLGPALMLHRASYPNPILLSGSSTRSVPTREEAAVLGTSPNSQRAHENRFEKAGSLLECYPIANIIYIYIYIIIIIKSSGISVTS